MSALELQQALDGPAGSLSAYLEAGSDAEIRADILALTESKRERFAAMAMQGLCANHSYLEQYPADAAAKDAVIYADALIAELAK